MSTRRLVAILAFVLVGVVLISLMWVGQRADRLTIAGIELDRVEVRLNEFTQSSQSNVALDMDARGNVVAAWDSRRQDSGTYGVFCRWLDCGGAPRSGEEQVNVERRSMQMRPAVTLTDGGQAWLAWESFNQDGELGSIIGRGTGAAGDEHVVTQTTAGSQEQVAADRLRDGRRVVAWSTCSTTTQTSRIAVRIFTETGQPVTDEILIGAPDGARDQLPSVAATGDGGFVVAWARVDGGGSHGVHACVFDADGNGRSSTTRVSRPEALAIEPSIAADAAGNFVVAWLRLDPETDYDVMVRRYRPDGTPHADAWVANEARAGWQSGAAVAMAPGGRCLVAWNTLTADGADADIHARLFDAAGRPLTGDFRVNRHTSGIQSLAVASGVRRLALADDGRIACAWEGNSGQGDPSAANVTLLIPSPGGLDRDLAAGIRASRRLFASLLPDSAPQLVVGAAPYLPPSFDAESQSPLLDPDPYVVGASGIGFTGFTSTGWVPPDPHMAAGTEHLMAVVNGGIAALTKDGTLLWQEDIGGSGGFWAEIGGTGFVFDPEVIFDPFEQRFIAMANERSSDNRSFFLVAISSTSDPTDVWHKYRLDVTALAGSDIDSPNIAVDSQAIYLTADFFTGGQKYLIYILDKASVIDGGTPIATSYLRTGSQSFGLPVMYSDDAPTMYMIEHFENEPANTVRLWAINDPLGTPNISSHVLTVPTYYRPGDLRSMGTSERIETFDSRFWSCMYRDGSLWAAHHVALDNSPRITRARWYEIEMHGWPLSGLPTLKQSGTVAPPGDVYCSFNSIFANANGDAVMLFARSSIDELLSMSRVSRSVDDPLGQMSEPEVVKLSNTTYNQSRWGDYSAIATDPTDPNLFWMHHEYAVTSAVWHTWIASETFGTSASLSPAPEVRRGGLRLAPSPTRGAATLTFDLSEAAETRVEVYDVTGRMVRQVTLGQLGRARHTATWDGRDQQGAKVPGGVYLLRVTAGGRVVGSERLVVTR